MNFAFQLCSFWVGGIAKVVDVLSYESMINIACRNVTSVNYFVLFVSDRRSLPMDYSWQCVFIIMENVLIYEAVIY